MKYQRTVVILLLAVNLQMAYPGPQDDRSNMIDENLDVFIIDHLVR
jgi:hypothetical protein